MTIPFKQLQEKLVEGKWYPYLINPTKSEILGFVKRQGTASLRGLWWEDNFYIWKAFDGVHYTFARDILGVVIKSPMGMKEVPIDLRVNIDPTPEWNSVFDVPPHIKTLVLSVMDEINKMYGKD